MPRRRGKAEKTLLLEQAILQIVEARHPVTVRGVCYALFAEGLIESMAVKETGRISRVMTEMRETGLLDWTRIVDGSREAIHPLVWNDPDERIAHAVRNYRRDNWQEQPYHVEVWSEKSTVQGVLAPVLDEYGVTFRVMKGFGSYTAVRQAAEDSIDAPGGKPYVALYLGDWDPSGLFMSTVDLPGRLGRYGGEWLLVRIALLDDDLACIPHFDSATKRTDGRFDWYLENTTSDPSKAWELDAMDPNDLRQRVEDEITSLIDHDAWDRAIEVEAAEVESMGEFHRSWKASKRVGGGR
ncbi:MAG: hypothetical protein ACOYLX_17935 [Burkholderiaceae bacterium]